MKPVSAIVWRDAEKDPPPKFHHILAIQRDHPEKPAGECYITDRPFYWAFFPALEENAPIRWWAELPLLKNVGGD